MQTKIYLFSFLFILFNIGISDSQNRVVISDKENQEPHESAILDLISEDKGFLLPRLESDDRNNITDPAESLLIFNEETGCVETYVQAEWHELWCYEPGAFSGPCEGFDGGVEYEGQTYEVVEIGDQCWFAENINVGSRIDSKDSEDDPQNQGTDCDNIEKYCYDDEESNCDIYGGFYQWDQAMCGETTEGSQGICPDGWHIPSDDDWKILEMELGMSETAANNTSYRGPSVGSRLAGGEDLWDSGSLIENTAFNESGFKAIPTGYRSDNSGNSLVLGERTYMWTSTNHSDDLFWTRRLDWDRNSVYRWRYNRERGFAVRCLLDNS